MSESNSNASRKRSRSQTGSATSDERERPRAPKRQRNHSNENNNTNNYSLRSRNAPPPPPPPSSPPPTETNVPETTTTTTQTRYNFRPRRPPATATRQYRLLYIDNDDDDDDDDPRSITDESITRTTSNSSIDRSSSPTTSDFGNAGVAHVRLNRAIEIVIDSIQSLEGAVNNFDQLVFGLIYGRLSSRTELESIEGMLRLSRILNFNFSSRLSQAEIDALPTIKFNTKLEPVTSVLLMEKCPICLTEFLDQEVINKLHCTHLFHRQCISTWLCENDSCPTCRRKVNQQNI